MSKIGIFRAPPVEDLQPHFPQHSIDAFVAVGGMGAVYRATQLSVDRPVALKILPFELAKEEVFRKRFTMEAKAMAKLSHRNLVQIYDFGETNGICWMMQEWVEGSTIFDVMHAETRLEPEEAAALVAQACEGLGYAHQQGIVHRDVKPANMMVNEDGILKLMDFGLARAIHDGPEKALAPGEARFATEEYGAPELWDRHAVIDHRVDIFALGVLLYEALTGARPTGPFRMPSELRPGLDPRFNRVVSRAMQRDPADRYESCGELLSALRKIVTTSAQVTFLSPVKSTTAAVRLKVPASSKAGSGSGASVPLATAVQPAPPEKKSAKGMLVVVGVLLLASILGGGWIFLTANGRKDAAQEGMGDSKSADGEGGAQSPKGRSAGGETESGQQRVNRQARERKARLAAGGNAKKNSPRQGAPDPDGEPDPGLDPGPESGPEKRSILESLAALDEEFRVTAADSCQSYRELRTDLEEKFLEECAKEEAKAVQAGDLDAVVFWQAEARVVRAGAEPRADEEGAPGRAVALRSAWRTRLGPSQAPLIPMQKGYLERLGELEAAAESDDERSMLRERRDKVVEFHQFVALLSGEAPPFQEEALDDGSPRLPGGTVAERVAGVLPADLMADYTTAQQRLGALQQSGDRESMATLIKNYGSSLVRSERTLTREGKIEAAMAVREVKEEMLALLKQVEEGGPASPERQPTVASRKMTLINNGDPTDECLYNRKEWKRKGKALVCEGIDSENDVYPKLQSASSLGRGDFKVTMRMTCRRIGATELTVVLGETVLKLDDDDGQMVIRASGGSVNEVEGANLGSLARAGVPFECVIQRLGSQLEVLVNGKEGVKATIHDRELGRMTLRPGSGRLEVENLVMEGGLERAPRMQRLADRESSGRSKGEVQLIPTGGGGLTALFIAWRWNESGRNELWAQRSRDGGTKWDDDYQVLGMDAFEVGMSSFAVACDQRRDEIHAVVATGKANQRLYLMKGRNGGRNWSGPEEITGMAKKPGWNVELSSQGVLVTRNQRKAGRIILPMHVGTDRKRLHLLVSDNRGREWKVIGPLTESSQGDAEIMEDEEGILWVAVGSEGGREPNRFRLVVSSADGGETWSEAVTSAMPDAGRRGALAFGMHPDKKPVWYYASAKPVLNEDDQYRLTHLTLFFSRDRGETWKELRRVHYGGWSYPTLVPLDPGRVGICYLSNSSHSGSEQIRFVDADGLFESP